MVSTYCTRRGGCATMRLLCIPNDPYRSLSITRECVRQTFTGGIYDDSGRWVFKGDNELGRQRKTSGKPQCQRRTSANGHQGSHCLLGDANVITPIEVQQRERKSVPKKFSNFVSSNSSLKADRQKSRSIILYCHSSQKGHLANLPQSFKSDQSNSPSTVTTLVQQPNPISPLKLAQNATISSNSEARSPRQKESRERRKRSSERSSRSKKEGRSTSQKSCEGG
ncbi:hypothetical protein QBC45DRAFT_400988 [Copromyces sp. CBS 386.78]|nr:hypothetical protein QBC45DRAFT_400988 [Copromyces sp. CBS 386.78]